MAEKIVVKNVEELNAANKKAKPGDIIILQDGEWKDAVIKLTCKGTAAKPIIFKAQSPGKLFFTGKSRVAIGGSYITIEGWHFKDGSAGKDDVISFRSSKEQAATYCRVTNCSINDYNDGKRLDENYWVGFYGHHNRLDHCSFLNKLNGGVLLAVMLEDKTWRDNYHSIDSNYFGKRPPLGSNGGEIIRVGVSQTSMYNSTTFIHHNLFLECDGEAEIISIKSGGNFIRDNVFKRCQGALVLRHGNNNTVEQNIFFGDGKESTGGVRVINEGQWVVNNLFMGLRGTGFRSPMAIMNGVPNSPVNRYLAVKDAVIANNTFFDCKAIGFGDGSDAERSAPPTNVYFVNNVLVNYADSVAIRFFEPKANNVFENNIIEHVDPQTFSLNVSRGKSKKLLPSSLAKQASKRLAYGWPEAVGFHNEEQEVIRNIVNKIFYYTGCTPQINYDPSIKRKVPVKVTKCRDFQELKKAIESGDGYIELIANAYNFKNSILIDHKVVLSEGRSHGTISLQSAYNLPALFVMGKNGTLAIEDMDFDLSLVAAQNFILADTTGSVQRFSLRINESSFRNMNRINEKSAFFKCPKSSYADMITISNNVFSNIKADLFVLNSETDNKGLYNTEEIKISGNTFDNNTGYLLDLYRGGNDESTLGPQLLFTLNTINQSQNAGGPLLKLTGVQSSDIFGNNFLHCNLRSTVILYKDTVRAKHSLRQNNLLFSGSIEKNAFVTEFDTIAVHNE